MVSGGFRPIYEAVLPGLTEATGHAARTLPSPSMGDTPGATQKRRCAADLGDVPIMGRLGPRRPDQAGVGPAGHQGRLQITGGFAGAPYILAATAVASAALAVITIPSRGTAAMGDRGAHITAYIIKRRMAGGCTAPCLSKSCQMRREGWASSPATKE